MCLAVPPFSELCKAIKSFAPVASSTYLSTRVGPEEEPRLRRGGKGEGRHLLAQDPHDSRNRSFLYQAMYQRRTRPGSPLPPPLRPRVRVVGLTGVVGAGKSEAAKLFARRGAVLLDADELAREVVAPGTPGLTELVREFGAEFLDPKTGALDRKRLAALIFRDAAARKRLEDLLHPRIHTLFKARLATTLAEIRPPYGALGVIVYVVPLLFESRYSYPELDCAVVVSAPLEVLKARIMKRDSCSAEQAEQKIATQLPLDLKEAGADFVIYNSSTLTALDEQIGRIYAALAAE